MTELADRLAIQDLNTRFAVSFDSFQLDATVDCWSEDGVLDERPIGFGLHEGQNEIRAFFRDKLFANARHVIHVMFNHLIDEIDGDKATGSAFTLVEIVRTDGVYARAHAKYEDSYVKVAGAWKFQSRTVRTSFPHDALSLPQGS